MAEFLNHYLFHWLPSKAIWIGGHTLTWDARCSGIYIGFGIGVFVQLAAGWKARRAPSLLLLALNALLFVPLFADVAALSLGYYPASNNARYLTGLLFGCAFSVWLYFAFVFLVLPAKHESKSAGVAKFFAPLLAAVAAAFFLKEWDSIAAYGVLEALSVFGFLSLAGILSVGVFKAAWDMVSKDASAAKSIFLITLVSIISGCAGPLQRPVRTETCNESSFVPAVNKYGDCRTEVCKDGKIVLVEDLVSDAPVDDWAEERFCLKHPIDCLRAYPLKDKTEKWQKDMTGIYWTKDQMRNGLGDATRHAHLMCVITEKFGADFARGVGIAHEEDSEYLIFSRHAAPSNPCCEKVMDLYNNEVGIMLAGKPGTCEEKVLNSLSLLRHSICLRRDKDKENPDGKSRTE